jgi:ATP-dependent Lhr-like helicase
MSENPFYRLAPFIQEFIYRNDWSELRPIQVQTTSAILDTPNHILITSGTASGKTEAAFLPILTELYNQPSATIGAMYIGPLKALINNQFERLETLLEDTDIPVQSWHGDVSQSKKRRFLKKAQGVLQITPESLEAMLMRRHVELGRLFGDLRFVVIDEVHAFIDSDRGRQVLCQLQRLERFQANPPRRIGLSATIGEPELAMRWLAGGSDVPVAHIDDKGSGRQLLLGLEHYPEFSSAREKQLEKARQNEDQTQVDVLETLRQDSLAVYDHIYDLTLRKKSLVFANSRSNTEELIANLRRRAEHNKTPDIYHVHHGSISAPLRETAEAVMQDPDQAACISATVTLELGIDIGKLEQVLQVNATHSVSSFVQRLGRSGRKENDPAKMFFYCREEVPEDDASLGQRIPWNFLQTIAIIQLYLEEQWIEPPVVPQLPLSLLYHQTMSIIAATTELLPPQLAEQVLTLYPFQQVTPEHYRALLRHLLELEHLEQTEIGGLIVGLGAERLVNNYKFYATFEDEEAFQVRDESREIGTIQGALPPGERFILAGHTWQVLDVNIDKRLIFVKRVKGAASTLWSGSGGNLHDRIVQRMRQVLREDQDYGYLQPRAQKRLAEARDLARQSGLLERSILPLGGDRFMIVPWYGTRIVNTMIMLLAHQGVKIPLDHSPFYFEIMQLQSTPDDVKHTLHRLASIAPAAEEIVQLLKREALQQHKYDRFVPDDLLREAFAVDVLDVSRAVAALKQLV